MKSVQTIFSSMNFIPPPRVRGFTILEMLVVICVIAILSVSTIPSFQLFGSASGVDQGLYDVAGLLELARSEAIARQTYVWVGFGQKEQDGQSVLRMAAVCSTDGSADLTPAKVVRLSRVIQVKNALLVNWFDLKSATRANFTGGTPVSVAENSTSMVPDMGGEYLAKSITFTPRGEALLNASPDADTPYDKCIDLSFRQTKGTVVLPGANDAAVIVDGCTGTIRQIRAQ